MKKFDFAIGNPPYNEDFADSGDNGNFGAPVYDKFMESAYKVANITELIHPARFLFNAGGTDKKWNNKMLNDEHFKVLKYEAKSSNVFANTDIKGGVAITYYDLSRKFSPIKIFTPFSELNDIFHKVMPHISSDGSMMSEISGRGVYKLSDVALTSHPEIEKMQSKGHKKDVGSGAFKKLNNIVFFDQPNDNENEWVKFLGIIKNKRIYKWTPKKFQDVPESFYNYKVFIPKANGSGALGEILSTPLIGEPLIGEPLIGATETFLSIGNFKTKEEAENCMRYIKSKFARVMLGVLKITQDNTKAKWAYVPLQNFTKTSDINWSKSIQEIDQQLYKKYNLSDEEIEFIETHVKEMD